jgi:hypothetical protein
MICVYVCALEEICFCVCSCVVCVPCVRVYLYHMCVHVCVCAYARSPPPLRLLLRSVRRHCSRHAHKFIDAYLHIHAHIYTHNTCIPMQTNTPIYKRTANMLGGRMGTVHAVQMSAVRSWGLVARTVTLCIRRAYGVEVVLQWCYIHLKVVLNWS